LDFAEPAVQLGFLDAVSEVGDDLDQSGPGLGVQPHAWAAKAREFVFAGGAVGASALAEFELAELEVLVEFLPLLVGRLAVLGLGSEGPSLVEERAVGADQFVLEDREVCLCGAKVCMAEYARGDVAMKTSRKRLIMGSPVGDRSVPCCSRTHH